MSDRLKIYVGYDSREDVAFQVCRLSLLRQSKADLQIYAVKQPTLRELGLYTRPFDKTSSTEFSLTRFLTPYLAASEDWTVFVDCDFLFTADIAKMVSSLDRTKAVHVVQHDYRPRNASKMDSQGQTTYPRKNWSSFMVFNGSHPDVRALTPDLVNTANPAFLHRFAWTSDDAIGSLPLGWNFLVGEYEKPAKTPPAIHFTLGGPWFPNCKDVDYANLWLAERDLLPRELAA
jgi:lipopolysaccharide biosynthesis glycosyltransferase